MTKKFTVAERVRLQKACPENINLHYNYTNETYEFLYKPPGAATSKLVGSVPRARVVMWNRPNAIMSHACRHALHAHQLPTKVKIAGLMVDVYTEES